MINEFKIKEQMCEIGRRVYARGFAAANDGNITYRLNERQVFCTPTMVCKGFLKPDDICLVDYDGKQLAGKRKRTSEVMLHLAVYKTRPDVQAVVHCHPPHATAFAVAHEPIPKCILPEVEVFLGEVPIARYETPGDQRFAATILPFVKNCNTIILANHGTVTFGPDLEKAYWNSEIIDAYCKILILAKQLGPINYFSEEKTRELLALKKRLGYDDPRLHQPACDICGDGVLTEADPNFVLEPQVFRREAGAETKPSANGKQSLPQADFDKLVQAITERVMAEMVR
ncbi:MAG TPA: class II aldolase/adducin family protein [Gemmataceae bacterium]|jgi:L-fuculose-phosphate aldolase|nr:class II aldolase/adducin family protein [Gemmataceae bacterium]